MKKKNGFYLARALKDTRFAFKYIPLSQRGLLMVYALIAFIGKLFFFTRPFFTIAEDNLATLIHDRKTFSVWQMFNGIAKRGNYARLVVSYFVTDLLTIFGLVLLAIIPVAIWIFLIPTIASNEVQVGLYNTLVLFFPVLGILLLLVAYTYYTPLAYVSMRYPQEDAGSILALTHKTITRQGKVNIFVFNFAYLLFFILLILLISLQSSTTVFGTLVVAFGYRGFLPTLIFSILYLLANLLLLLWLIPLGYLHLLMTGHHLMTDTLAPVPIATETPSSQLIQPEELSPLPTEPLSSPSEAPGPSKKLKKKK